MEFYCITRKKPDLHLQLTNHDIFPTLVEEQVFIICLRTNVCVQRYGGVLASYPDVSFSMKIFEQRKAGRRKRASPRFLLLPVVHCVSSPVHPRFAPEEEAGEVLFVSLYKIISQNVVLLSFFTAINVNHSYVCFII